MVDLRPPFQIENFIVTREFKLKRISIILIATFTISLTFGQNKNKTDKDDIKVAAYSS